MKNSLPHKLLAFTLVSLASSLVFAQSWRADQDKLLKLNTTNDLVLIVLTLDGRKIEFPRAVYSFISNYTSADFRKPLNQVPSSRIPDSPALSAFRGKINAANEKCPSKNILNQKLALAENTQHFEVFLQNPQMMYRELPFATPTDSSFETLDGVMNIVFGLTSKMELPKEKGSSANLANLRLDHVLRKINIDRLLKLGQSAASVRNELLNLHQLGCLELSDITTAQALYDSTLEDLKALRVLKARTSKDSQRYATMPYPQLDPSDRRILSMNLGAFLWRFRGAGGYKDIGTQSRRRMFVALGFAQIGVLNSRGASYTTQFADSLRWGVQTVSWGKYYDMGRNEGDKQSDYEQMQLIGSRVVDGAAYDLAQTGLEVEPLRQAGLNIASCYYLAWEKMPALYWIGKEAKPPMENLSGAPTGIGELCAGAGIGLALSAILQ